MPVAHSNHLKDMGGERRYRPYPAPHSQTASSSSRTNAKTADFYPPRPLSPPHALKDLNEENRRLYPDIAAQMDANKRKEEEEAAFASKFSKSRNEPSLLSPKEEKIVARGVSSSSFSPGSAPTSAPGVDTRHPRIEKSPHLIQQPSHPIKQQGRPNLGLTIPPETNLDDLITSPHVPLTPRQLHALSQFVQHASVRSPSNTELRSPVERTCDPRKRTVDPRKRPRLSKDSQYIVDEAQARAKMQNMAISSPQAMSKASSNSGQWSKPLTSPSPCKESRKRPRDGEDNNRPGSPSILGNVQKISRRSSCSNASASGSSNASAGPSRIVSDPVPQSSKPSSSAASKPSNTSKSEAIPACYERESPGSRGRTLSQLREHCRRVNSPVGHTPPASPAPQDSSFSSIGNNAASSSSSAASRPNTSTSSRPPSSTSYLPTPPASACTSPTIPARAKLPSFKKNKGALSARPCPTRYESMSPIVERRQPEERRRASMGNIQTPATSTSTSTSNARRTSLPASASTSAASSAPLATSSTSTFPVPSSSTSNSPTSPYPYNSGPRRYFCGRESTLRPSHREPICTPHFTVVENCITILTTDADVRNRPGVHPIRERERRDQGGRGEAESEFERKLEFEKRMEMCGVKGKGIYFEEVELARKISLEWRREVGAFLAREVLGLEAGPDEKRFVLSKYPEHYAMFVLNNEPDDRQDYYLYGSLSVHCFRSPQEFGFHAKWLMLGKPLTNDGRPDCRCTYCSGVEQGKISEEYFGRKKPERRGSGTVQGDGGGGGRGGRRVEQNRIEIGKARDYRRISDH
ncbi:uncharacterized protein STEHIDRAFT_120118 [Stereum hirsutum FP-91666 SS1]|uniref:uncharacterized protein n=1 Tax=Stereum hirsutum (strain FP-91666) TaxID=721885 RepID=UPI000440ACB1|nr:uncharacterized protein STEHIDRAFT_120118 [Stereum hirsutum FP-91666 SS1]EIM87846.1 hypothetical protein STEHIDRAFT_120118 [Stereum hirsutum FP-91666 SS1]